MSISSERRRFLEQYVVKENFVMASNKTTVCCMTLYNGFEIIGYSSCVDPKAFNKELGEVYAREDALEKLNPFFGFLQVDRAHVQSPLPKVDTCGICGKQLPPGVLRVASFGDGDEEPRSIKCLNCVD